jgi:16S rRNA (cytosine1402-N4)-methyltransferase
MASTNYHQPVLLHDCIAGLNLRDEGVYVDVTFGGGGHSREILKHLGKKGKLYAFDQDPDAAKNTWEDPRLIFIPNNFRHMKNYLQMQGEKGVDGILADLGVSSHQFDEAERGFSIRFNAKLDMRMSQSGKLTASEIVNAYDQTKLTEIFKNYGEIENASKLAYTILRSRSEKVIASTEELKAVISKCVVRKDKEQQYYARVFQALRIEVNNEVGALQDFLDQSQEMLKPGGRLVVISYHSLEDRLVKNKMKTGNCNGEIKKDFFGVIERPFSLITKKPIEPTEQEINKNTRARSAKLRIAEKI